MPFFFMLCIRMFWKVVGCLPVYASYFFCGVTMHSSVWTAIAHMAYLRQGEKDLDNKKNQRILRHTGGVFSQAVIEGEVALPVGKPEMARLLLVRGRAEAGSVESLDQRAMTDGTLTLCVCYLDTDDQLHAFESVSTFKHTADVPGAQAGMRGTAMADVSEIETSLTDGRRINVSAVIDILFFIADEVDLAYLGSGSEDGLVYRTKPLMLERRCARATTAAEISGESVLPQGQPGIAQVLNCQGQAAVQQAFAENDLLCVEGELKVSIAYATSDPNNPIAQSFAQIPFSEMLPAPGAGADQRVLSTVKVKDLHAQGTEDGDAIKIRAVCAIELESQQPIEIEAVEDAYAIKGGVQIKSKTIPVSRCVGNFSGVEAVRETVALQNVEDAGQILAVFATPSAARAMPNDGSVTIESVMSCQIVYKDTDGRLLSKTVQWPMQMEQQIPQCTQECMPMAQLYAEQAQAAMNADGVDVRILLNWQVQVLQMGEAAIADQIMLIDKEENPAMSGIIVYFTSKGDTLWDIAKRYRISPADVMRYNENVQEPFADGQRLILLSRNV